MPEPAITVRGLKKSYGSFEAVKGIDLDVAQGEVFSLLGPNGAGKTTTVEILEGYRPRSAGDVTVLGHDPQDKHRAFKERIGIVLQETGIERYLTVAETIDQFRAYYPRPRDRDEIIELVGLEEKRDSLVRRLSGGQQRRLDVAIGLAGDPELLFLDEPTTGFDPAARREAWKMITNLRDLGKTIFLTTHYMEEAQHLADRVAIIVGGKLVAQGPPGELAQGREAVSRITFRLPPNARLPETVAAERSIEGDSVTIETADPVRVLHSITEWAMGSGIELGDLTVARRSLEDVYLQLTARKEEPE